MSTHSRTYWTFSFKLHDSDEWRNSNNRWRDIHQAANNAATFLEENSKLGIEAAVRLVKSTSIHSFSEGGLK